MRTAGIVALSLATLVSSECVAAQSPEEPGEPEKRLILRKSENMVITFSGRVHRMVLAVDDGANTDLFFTDSEQGPTMVRFDAMGKASRTLSIGATIETGIRQNRPFLVSQDSPEPGTDVTVRIAELVLDSARLGKLSLGRGFAAAWLAPEMDLSGTQYASLLPVGMLAPGMKFVNASDDSLSNIQVLNYFTDVERLLLVDRLRYDSPGVGPGLQFSASVANDSRWDLALRVKPKPSDDWTFVGGASYQDKPFLDIDRRWDAVGSIRNNPTGLNLTVGGAADRFTSGQESSTWIVKAGWLADFIDLGKTAFEVDYYRVNDAPLGGDAQSVGVFAVQKWPDFGLDFYAGYRIYEILRSDIDLKNLNIIAAGAVLNF